jgi:hypothetical protein
MELCGGDCPGLVKAVSVLYIRDFSSLKAAAPPIAKLPKHVFAV